MSKLPPELAKIKPFLVRGIEMEKANPIVSYYCNLYALQQTIKQAKATPTPEIQNYARSLFEMVEKRKAEIGDLSNGKEEFENFVVFLFCAADNEDRKTGSTKDTAKKFLVLSHFIEVMNVFDELPPDWEEKRKYSKWKANDILRAIKEGRVPTPGGPNEQAGEIEDVARLSPPPQPVSIHPNTLGQEAAGDSYGASSFFQLDPTPPPSFNVNPSPTRTYQDSDFNPSPPAPVSMPPPTTPSPVAKPPEPKPVRAPEPVKAPEPVSRPAASSVKKAGPSFQANERKAISDASKLAQYAISELEFKNIRQAKENLRKALEALEIFSE